MCGLKSLILNHLPVNNAPRRRRTDLCSSSPAMSARFPYWRLMAPTVVGLIVLFFGTACRTDSKAVKQRYLESGNQYAAAGKYAEAVIEYRNALQLDPRAGAVHE